MKRLTVLFLAFALVLALSAVSSACDLRFTQMWAKLANGNYKLQKVCVTTNCATKKKTVAVLPDDFPLPEPVGRSFYERAEMQALAPLPPPALPPYSYTAPSLMVP